jgi:hypothetical protein
VKRARQGDGRGGPKLPHLTALRYVQPLREGGSLPAIVDTEDGLFVMKFRGAGQGPRALVAELIVGMLAQHLGLATPELAVIDMPPQFGRSEPDPEIQDLLRASHGCNIGVRFLDGAFNFAVSAAGDLLDSDFAARVVWLDAFTTNPDRTHRNPNLLIWNREAWLIDHGAALYAHHDWASVDLARTRSSFPLIRDHVLLSLASNLEAVDEELAGRITEDALRAMLARIPDELLTPDDDPRQRYLEYLTLRAAAPRAFVTEAVQARALYLAETPLHLSERR